MLLQTRYTHPNGCPFTVLTLTAPDNHATDFVRTNSSLPA